MPEFAVGTTVFLRTERLCRLLESVDPEPVTTVYVADVGETEERRGLYDREWPFDLEVLDLAYDAGVSRGRRAVVEAMDESEEFLLVVDSDNTVPEDAPVLADQLDALPDVGGIAGTLVEPELGRVYQPATDLAEHGDALIKSSRLRRKEVEQVAGAPFVPFDFVPNVTMFRRACLDDYCWDPEYTVHKEHIDFFVGHWKRTDWAFGVCPAVLFPHYPGGAEAYRDHRFDDEEFERLTRYFYDKWGYTDVRSPHAAWFDTHKVTDPTMGPRDLVDELPMTPERLLASTPTREPRSLPRRAYDVYRERGLAGLVRATATYLRGDRS